MYTVKKEMFPYYGELLETMTGDEDAVIMTVTELRKIRDQIYDLEEAAENRTWIPGTLGDMSTINKICDEK